MQLNVLAAGEISSGKSKATGNDWHRRILQVFTADQVAGNIPVFGTPEELASYKQGVYTATVQTVAGANGQIEIRITKLTPAKSQQ